MLPSHCYPPLCWLVVHRHRHPLRILYGDKDDVDIVVDPTPIQVVVAWYYHTISECIPYIEVQKVENEEIAASPCRMNVLWLQWHLCKWPHWKPVETWPHDPRPCGWKAPLHTVFSTLSFVLLALCCSLLYNGVGMVKCVKSRRRKRERKPAQEVELGPFTICSGAWMGVQLLLANPREKWFQSLTLLETNDKSLFHPPQRDACHSFILAEHKVMPLAFYLPLVIKRPSKAFMFVPRVSKAPILFICIVISMIR